VKAKVAVAKCCAADVFSLEQQAQRILNSEESSKVGISDAARLTKACNVKLDAGCSATLGGGKVKEISSTVVITQTVDAANNDCPTTCSSVETAATGLADGSGYGVSAVSATHNTQCGCTGSPTLRLLKAPTAKQQQRHHRMLQATSDGSNVQIEVTVEDTLGLVSDDQVQAVAESIVQGVSDQSGEEAAATTSAEIAAVEEVTEVDAAQTEALVASAVSVQEIAEASVAVEQQVAQDLEASGADDVEVTDNVQEAVQAEVNEVLAAEEGDDDFVAAKTREQIEAMLAKVQDLTIRLVTLNTQHAALEKQSDEVGNDSTKSAALVTAVAAFKTDYDAFVADVQTQNEEEREELVAADDVESLGQKVTKLNQDADAKHKAALAKDAQDAKDKEVVTKDPATPKDGSSSAAMSSLVTATVVLGVSMFFFN
jgi:hypothetical protein